MNQYKKPKFEKPFKRDALFYTYVVICLGLFFVTAIIGIAKLAILFLAMGLLAYALALKKEWRSKTLH